MFAINPGTPTNHERHTMIMNNLIQVGRPEDYYNTVQLLSPPPDITNYGMPGSFKGVKVGIIGGGVAGLSAAFELRKLGFEIVIFESNNERIGGRIYTHFFDKSKNLYGELGAMRIPVSHETSWHYINLFKLKMSPFIETNPNTFTYARGIRVKNDVKGKNVVEKIYPEFQLTSNERNTPWPALYDDVIRSTLLNIPPMIRREILQVLPEYHYPYKSYTEINLRQVLKLSGLSEGAIDLITSVMSPLNLLLYSEYGEALSEEYSLTYNNLFRIVGGTVELPKAFYNSLTSQRPEEYDNIHLNALGRVRIKQGAVVNGIYKSDTVGKTILKYTDEVNNECINESFDYVICTLPLSQLRKFDINPLFSARKMRGIREVNYMDAQKTIFLCRERFWEKGNQSERIIGGQSYTDLLIGRIVYPSDHVYCTQLSSESTCSPNEPGVFIPSYNFDLDAIRLGNMAEEERFYLIKRQVEEVHGLSLGHLDPIVVDYKTVHWNTESGFYGGFATFLPAQRKDFFYELSKPEYDNRVFFAGEHTTAEHGWIQGALQSGMLSANRLAFCAGHHNHWRRLVHY